MGFGDEDAVLVEQFENAIHDFVDVLDVGEDVGGGDRARFALGAPGRSCTAARLKKEIWVAIPRSMASLPALVGSMPYTRQDLVKLLSNVPSFDPMSTIRSVGLSG